MSLDQRPREKALRQGLNSLSDLELIALILQSGSKDRSVFDIAQDVLIETEGLSQLFNMHVNSLMKIKGIREVKALQLLAGVELCKRVLKTNTYRMQIKNSQDVIQWFKVEYGYLTQENFVCVYLDTKARIISHRVLAIGTLNEACVHPRDVFKEAYLQNAAGVICVHNHPSGDPSPSLEDINMTKQLVSIAKMNGIQFIDHVIVAKSRYYSFCEVGMLASS